MGLISEYLRKIKEAVYGEEVRDSIHDAIEQCYKDAVGHPESVAAVVNGLVIEREERKTEIDVERKRIDGLSSSQTFSSNYIQSNLVFHAYSGTTTGDPDPDDNYYYEGMSTRHEMPAYKNFVAGTLTLAEKQSNEKVKILKEGLYIFELRIRVSGTGRLDIESRINDNSQRNNAQLITAQSAEEIKVLSYILYLKENDVVSFYGTPQTSAQVSAPVADVNCYAFDWIGKAQISDCSKEISDIRVGTDGMTYQTAGEAIRMQLDELIKAINSTGLQQNLLPNYRTSYTRCNVIATVNMHELNITGTVTGYGYAMLLAVKVENVSLKIGKKYFAYGFPEGTYIKAQLNDKSTKDVRMENGAFIIPEGTDLFVFVVNVNDGNVWNYTSAISVYDEAYKGSFQQQIDTLNNKIDAMQAIITKVVTAPTLTTDENGSLQITESKEG